jgi:hypothetical protein
MKRNLKIISLAFSISLFFSSCLTTKTNVGQFKENDGATYQYSKGKQMWLFWGLMPLGRKNVNTPSSGDCQVTTRFTLGDALISGLTGGLLSSYTIKVDAKK